MVLIWLMMVNKCVYNSNFTMVYGRYIHNYYSGWWYTYPPEKYEFVRLDHHPNYWGK